MTLPRKQERCLPPAAKCLEASEQPSLPQDKTSLDTFNPHDRHRRRFCTRIASIVLIIVAFVVGLTERNKETRNRVPITTPLSRHFSDLDLDLYTHTAFLPITTSSQYGRLLPRIAARGASPASCAAQTCGKWVDDWRRRHNAVRVHPPHAGQRKRPVASRSGAFQ